MSRKISFDKVGWLLAVPLLLLGLGSLGAVVPLPIQDQLGRDIWDTGLKPAPESKPGTPRYKVSGHLYRKANRKATPGAPTGNAEQEVHPDGVKTDAVLGVTVWHLRTKQSRGKPSDAEPKILVRDERQTSAACSPLSDGVKLVPESVEADTTFEACDRVRLSIEPGRKSQGHLYIINREQYADGSMSAPYLIFPTKQDKKDSHIVSVGRVFEVPPENDNPPYFRLRPLSGDKKQVAEVLIVLVSAKELDSLRIDGDGARPTPLTGEAVKKVAAWEKLWKEKGGRLELENGKGRPWTKEDQAAGRKERILTREDQPPQSLFYLKEAEPGLAIAVLSLQYGSAQPPKK